jgi:hypothetical protein
VSKTPALSRLAELADELDHLTDRLLIEEQTRQQRDDDTINVTTLLEKPRFSASWFVDKLDLDGAMELFSELHRAIEKAAKRPRPTTEPNNYAHDRGRN